MKDFFLEVITGQKHVPFSFIPVKKRERNANQLEIDTHA